MAEIRTGPAQLYIQMTPECPVHGLMKPRAGEAQGYTATTWECPGWDGEGCDYKAPETGWQQIGTTDGLVIYRD